jgi:hypothetical protein
MDIQITDEKTLGAVKEEFQAKFPHLKLEFYDHSHKEGEGSPERYLLDDAQTIGEARKTKKEGGLSINANQKTNTLENRFKEHYGLNVQVFRKSGKLWMQTTSTDEWTLSHQEEVGKNHDR